MLSTGLNRCLLYVPRRFPLGLKPGNRLRRRPARPRERRLRGPRGPRNDRQATRRRLGPPQVPCRRGRDRRRAPGWPRRRQGSCARPIPGRAGTEFAWQKCVLDGFPVGRGALDLHRRVPRDASGPWRSTGRNLDKESTESGRCCSPKSAGRGRPAVSSSAKINAT